MRVTSSDGSRTSPMRLSLRRPQVGRGRGSSRDLSPVPSRYEVQPNGRGVSADTHFPRQLPGPALPRDGLSEVASAPETAVGPRPKPRGWRYERVSVGGVVAQVCVSRPESRGGRFPVGDSWPVEVPLDDGVPSGSGSVTWRGRRCRRFAPLTASSTGDERHRWLTRQPSSTWRRPGRSSPPTSSSWRTRTRQLRRWRPSGT